MRDMMLGREGVRTFGSIRADRMHLNRVSRHSPICLGMDVRDKTSANDANVKNVTHDQALGIGGPTYGRTSSSKMRNCWSTSP